MNRIVGAIAFAVVLGTGPASAATLDEALKTFAALPGDAAKFKTFCEMSKFMDHADDEKDQEKVGKQMDAYMQALGPDFAASWDLGDELTPETADGKAYGAAIEALSGKCPK